MPETQIQFVTTADLQALKINFTNAHRLVLEKDGRFPKRIHLGHRTVVYDATEIQDWIDARATERYIVNDPDDIAAAVQLAAELIEARRHCLNAIIDFPNGVSVHWRRDIGPAIDIQIEEGPRQFHIITVMVDGWSPYVGKDEFDPDTHRETLCKISDRIDFFLARVAAAPRAKNATILTQRIVADEAEKIRELLSVAGGELDKTLPLIDAPAWQPPPMGQPAVVASYRLRMKSE